MTYATQYDCDLGAGTRQNAHRSHAARREEIHDDVFSAVGRFTPQMAEKGTCHRSPGHQVMAPILSPWPKGTVRRGEDAQFAVQTYRRRGISILVDELGIRPT